MMEDGGNNCSYKMCKAPVKMSPPTNQHPVYLQAGCPSSCPANSVKALKGSWNHLYIMLLQNIEAQVDWIDLLVSHAPLHVICCVCVCVCQTTMQSAVRLLGAGNVQGRMTWIQQEFNHVEDGNAACVVKKASDSHTDAVCNTVFPC